MDSIDSIPIESTGRYKPRRSIQEDVHPQVPTTKPPSLPPAKGKSRYEETDDQKENDQAKKQIQKKATRSSKKSKSLRLPEIPVRLKLTVQFIFHALSLALAVIAYFSWTNPAVQHSDLVSNWQQTPITDIQLVHFASNCPAGYEQIQANMFNVGPICDCGANNIKLTPCSASDERCTDVSALNTFSLPLWRTYKVCVQRHQNGTLVNAINRRNHCSESGWTNCTSGPDPLCVPLNTPCPISKFYVVYGSPSLCPAGTQATLVSSPNNEPRYLCTSRDGNYPLVDIATTLGGRCVVSNTFNPYSKDNPQEGPSSLSVDVSTPPFPCGTSEIDARYTDVELRKMGSLFNDNTAAFTAQGLTTDQVAYWTRVAHPVFYKFQTRPELPFSEDCHHPRKDIVDSEQDLLLIYRAQTGLVLVTIVSCLLLYFPWVVWSCTTGRKDYDKKTPLFLVKSILTIASAFISSVLLVTSFNSIWKLRNILIDLAAGSCGDDITHAMFVKYESEMATTLWMDILIFGWHIISIILQIRQMIVLPTEKELRQKEFATRATEIELHEPMRKSFRENDDSISQRGYNSDSGLEDSHLQGRKSFDAVSNIDDLTGMGRKSSQTFQM